MTQKTLPQKNCRDDVAQTAHRKKDHLDLSVRSDIEDLSAAESMWDKVILEPACLSELNWEDCDLRTQFLGRTFAAPLLITGMTGGVEKGARINELLADAALAFSIPMGLGSQKLMIYNEEQYTSLFNVRKGRPHLFLIGNLGISAFNYGVNLDNVKRLVDKLELNAFAFHYNMLQECVQPEGERNFSNTLKYLEESVRALPVPVMFKDVGAGLSQRMAEQVLSTGVAALDCAGFGGTNWVAIESMRGDRFLQRLGASLRTLGVPTVRSLLYAVRARESTGNKHVALVASGGVRSGVHVAKALALGADMVAVGLPFLRAILSPPQGMLAEQALEEEFKFFLEGLKITMLYLGVEKINLLPKTLVKPTSPHETF